MFHPKFRSSGAEAAVQLPARHGWAGVLALATALALGACAEAPKTPVAVAPPVPTLADYLEQASKAAADGTRDRAADLYRQAAQAYPASKEPWVRMSQEAFATGDYARAIQNAQEVLHRDPSDGVASSVLAVSGLRVSTAALQSLRTQSRIAGDTRYEAETMTRTLRDVLGEDVLVPAAKPVVKPRPKAKPAAPKPVTAGASAPAATTTAAVASPFDKLR